MKYIKLLEASEDSVHRQNAVYQSISRYLSDKIVDESIKSQDEELSFYSTLRIEFSNGDVLKFRKGDLLGLYIFQEDGHFKKYWENYKYDFTAVIVWSLSKMIESRVDRFLFINSYIGQVKHVNNRELKHVVESLSWMLEATIVKELDKQEVWSLIDSGETALAYIERSLNQRAEELSGIDDYSF
jgi:hypothetical protein